MLDPAVLGIDIGSVSIAAAVVNAATVLKSDYRFHRGNVRDTLRSVLEELGPLAVRALAFTSSSPCLVPGALSFDPQVCLMAAGRRFFPDGRSILHIGGERFGLIRLDSAGAYRGARASSACAAGTGSFLDQQARRLGFPSSAELARRACAGAGGEPPRISTRCAVFARTDLVHAQQEGHTLDEICDGLCKGLAQNIADTVFGGDVPPRPMVFAGGVARNDAVRRHLERILGAPLLTHEHAPLFGAIGAALCCLEGGASGDPITVDPDLVATTDAEDRVYHYPALAFADAASEPRGATACFTGPGFSARHPVEVEIFSPHGPGEVPVRMGIDVGSTSTKAILVDGMGEPVAGFYTRTLGSPLTAVQAICEAVESHQDASGVSFRFEGVGATGAGRKFIGAIVKADLVVDEITAHARAAYALDPRIDTIIEIGGQDAKFTTMRAGMVTFSRMNTVCAAGTGSFLEEQAERLGCPLSDYEEKVRGVRAPLSSDRCAVFMERDLNTFLAQGFTTGEILAAALRSVRENYLGKVARGAAMGQHIAFQGATARNRALVAAFEEGLGKKIHVSRYCHLTGALGAALLLVEKGDAVSSFVGMGALREEIPVRSETCSLCTNHCRLRVATVGGETVAYGFLCGRDYDVGHFVERNRSGFDPVKERRKALYTAAMKGALVVAPAPSQDLPIVGIPSALALQGQEKLWERFFSLLGIPTVVSDGFTTAVQAGREIQGAEFCAPIAALHGHVRHLQGLSEWIFLPWFFDDQDERVQCYYTQYGSGLAARAGDPAASPRCLMPALRTGAPAGSAARELFRVLKEAGAWPVSLGAVAVAYERACFEQAEAARILQERFRQALADSADPCVVLLGRPYNILSPEMGKGIAGIFGSLGTRCFTQDMIPYEPTQVSRIKGLLDSAHWLNAARLLEAACVVADTPNLYPVFVTSFKCTPDSFVLEYFKRIFDEAGKPWLVLQLDDHDSTLGYETRIEAGVASFRNHAARSGAAASSRAAPLPVVPATVHRLGDRILLVPNWDPLSCPLLAANLRREGLDARLLEEDPHVIRRAMRHNTGQCLPLSIIAQEIVEYVRRHDLDPARTAAWIPSSRISCNIGMFAPFIKSLLESAGDGMEAIDVYAGDFFYIDVSLRAPLNAYKAYLAGGLLRRAGCRIRPREREPGAADRAIQAGLALLVPAFEGRGSRSRALQEAAALLDAVRVDRRPLPRAAIFGDLYVRDNEVMNQGLIRAIESAGGEAVTTPYTEYMRIVSRAYFRKMAQSGRRLDSLGYRALWETANLVGSRCAVPFARYLDPPAPRDNGGAERFLAAFTVRTEHVGESFDNLLKVWHLAQIYPDLALFVQASPAFCCPSIVTEAMAGQIERLTGVPVVSITYDGTGQYKNDALTPYLAQGIRAARPA